MSRRRVQILATNDAATIRQWAEECLRLGLYLPGGMVRTVFERKRQDIYVMAYAPRVGWAVYCRDPSKWGGKTRGHVFVKPGKRCQGYGSRLAMAAFFKLCGKPA